MTNRIENIYDDLRSMKGPILTVYLNTNPSSEDWKIHLKNGLKKTEEYTEASNPELVKQFSEISTKVDSTIKNSLASFSNSVICFASSEKVILHHLQIQVQNDFQWKSEPAIDQLENLFKMYTKSGVLLLQRDKITMITTLLGELIDETHYEFDLDKEHWTQYKGVAFGNIYASSANHRDKYDRRIKESQARWYKSIAPTIEKHAKANGWNGVHLAGPTELTKEINQHVQLNVVGETTQNYSGKSAHAILDRTILSK